MHMDGVAGVADVGAVAVAGNAVEEAEAEEKEDHKVACGHTEHGCSTGGSESHSNHHHHREDHKVACRHTEHGRPTGGSEGHSNHHHHHHHREDQRVACGHTEHGNNHHHHREDQRVACGHTEHANHHHKDQNITGKHEEFHIESRGNDAYSAAARGRVSKAAEWCGLAIENTPSSSSSLPMAAPESRSRRITRSMATTHVAASELLARALAATAINGDPSYEEAMASPQREQ